MHCYINRGEVTPMSDQARPLNGWQPGPVPFEFVLYRDGVAMSKVSIADGWWRATNDVVRYSTAVDAMAAAQIRLFQSA